MAPSLPLPEEEALRRGYNVMPVVPIYDHDIRFENRNAEAIHFEILEAARLEHERLRAEALRALEMNNIREVQEKIQREIRNEEERLQIEKARLDLEEKRVRTETQSALAEIKKRELEEAARNIPVVPPKPPTPPPVESPPVAPAPKGGLFGLSSASSAATFGAPTQGFGIPPVQRAAASQSGLFGTVPSVNLENVPPQPPAGPPQQANGFAQPSSRPQQTNGFPQGQQPPQMNGFQNSNNNPQSLKPTFAQPPLPPSSNPTNPATSRASHILPNVERYSEIFQNLKQLRAYLKTEAGTNIRFKKMYGEMRRTIRSTVGQMTSEKGANKAPMAKIITQLKKALYEEQSPPVDPSLYMVSKPSPTEGAVHNGDTLPSLFIYALNVFSKCVLNQFIDEASVRPETADPIGVVAISIFAQNEFLWRGRSLIDILMSKLRVVLPVVFGLRGNEKSEEGRKRLGWQRIKDGPWVDEQTHSNRMVGLAAGYASLCLRDFTKSKMRNPWPPTNYWMAMASITATPREEVSATQYTVLRSLIEGNEQRFLDFYGSVGIAALRVALVEFPRRATVESKVAAGSLSVLVDKLERDRGLLLG